MRTLESRLQWILVNYNFTSLAELSLASGLSRATLYNAVHRERATGSANLSLSAAQSVAKRTRLSAEWVLTGKKTPEHKLPERQASSRNTRSAPASSVASIDPGVMETVFDTLVTQDGVDRSVAGPLVGEVLFNHPQHRTAMAVYRAARELLESRAQQEAKTSTGSKARTSSTRRVGSPARKSGSSSPTRNARAATPARKTSSQRSSGKKRAGA